MLFHQVLLFLGYTQLITIFLDIMMQLIVIPWVCLDIITQLMAFKLKGYPVFLQTCSVRAGL